MEIKQQQQNHEGRRDEQPTKQQVQLSPAGLPAPPSPSSSPSHEFSFTISLENPPEAADKKSTAAKSPTTPPFAAVDLSPADEIFFHGHLLPLHLLSHPPAASPRSSTDSFTLPIKELLPPHHHHNNSNSDNTNNNKTSSTTSAQDDGDDDDLRSEEKGRSNLKSKSFSLFGNMPKWRKLGLESKDDFYDQKNSNSNSNSKPKPKSKLKFEVLKRYIGLILPFLSNRGRGGSEFRRYSYSGNLKVKSKKELRGRRGEFSAPATMITSPANSGILMGSGAVTPTSAKSDSTMEELQAAIQAAIAHCKNSVATEDKIKLP